MMAQSPHKVGVAMFQARNRLFGALASAAVAVILAVIGLTLFVIIRHWDVIADTTLRRLALTWCPTPFYLWALWSLRTMFVDLAKAGITFQPTLVTAIMRVGWGLLLGAITTLATTPFILALGSHHGMTGAFATFNVPALTIALVGLALIAAARILRHGVELEAESASLKAELEEFF